MHQIRLVLSVLMLGLVLVACRLSSLGLIPQPVSTNTPEVFPSEIPPTLVEPTIAINSTEVLQPSETPAPSSFVIPPFLSSIPGIDTTISAVLSTPDTMKTLVAQQTIAANMIAGELPQLATPLLKGCPNPSDPPLKEWMNVPVMPQATAGQKVDTLIGSYYCFRAPVSAQQMESFYKSNLQPPDWMMTADANGNLQFMGLSQSGIQMLFLVSGPGNKNDLVVAVNETRPLAVPTP
jgi:hypothetical protein